MAVRIQGLKGRHRTAQGNALGFDAIIAIKRCKRATILLLTQRPSNVVAQVWKPAYGRLGSLRYQGLPWFCKIQKKDRTHAKRIPLQPTDETNCIRRKRLSSQW